MLFLIMNTAESLCILESLQDVSQLDNGKRDDRPAFERIDNRQPQIFELEPDIS